MKNLRYCPACGKENLTFTDNKKWHCTECDFVLYHNIAAAVAVIIRVDDEIFLTERAIAPQVGYLDLPGGFSDANETAEETCLRELEEELGIQFSIEQLRYLGSEPNIYPYKGIIYHTMDLFFELSLNEKFSPIIDNNEIKNALWIPISEIELDKIAFNSQRKLIEKIKNRDELSRLN